MEPYKLFDERGLKAQRLPKRGKMMQASADYLDGLRAGARVVGFKRFA
jgi:hypothetical protein